MLTETFLGLCKEVIMKEILLGLNVFHEILRKL